MAGNQVRYGPNGAGNQAPGRSASMLTRTSVAAGTAANSDPPCSGRKLASGNERVRQIARLSRMLNARQYGWLSLMTLFTFVAFGGKPCCKNAIPVNTVVGRVVSIRAALSEEYYYKFEFLPISGMLYLSGQLEPWTGTHTTCRG